MRWTSIICVTPFQMCLYPPDQQNRASTLYLFSLTLGTIFPILYSIMDKIFSGLDLSHNLFWLTILKFSVVVVCSLDDFMCFFPMIVKLLQKITNIRNLRDWIEWRRISWFMITEGFLNSFPWRKTFVGTRCSCNLGVLCVNKFLK